jgi:hypothetical protein
MSRIEAHSKRFVGAMMQGEHVVLEPSDQQQVTTWATLRTLVHDHTHPQERVVPDAHYAQMYALNSPTKHTGESERPLPTYTVWLGRFQGLMPEGRFLCLKSPITVHPNHAAANLAASLARGEKAFSVTFVADRLVIVVLGHQAPGVIGQVHDVVAGPHFRRIWPTTETFTWPPDQPVDELGGPKRLYRFFTFVPA